MSNPLSETSGLPQFDRIKPEHAVAALTELIAAQKQKLEAILADDDARDFDSLVVPLEAMSHELSRVWSPISHLQSVLDDPAWRDAYNEALPLMTEYGTELSQNKALHSAYEAVAAQMPADAPAEQVALLEQELRDFRLAGVALPDDVKATFKDIRRQLAALQAGFDQNLQDATDHWHFHTESDADVAGIPATVLRGAAEDAGKEGVAGWWFRLNYPNYHAVMTHCDHREVREKFYRAWSTRASDQDDSGRWDNSDTMQQILALRHRMAGLVGFDNYAEYSLATKMAGTVGEVTEFLETLAERSRQAAETELDEIQAIAPHAVEAWDLAYYFEKLKQQKFSISDEALRKYFPFEVVKRGMFDVAEQLYGLAVSERGDVSTWHADVRFYELRDPDGNVVGSFYTDLFARTGKRGGAWMDECIVRERLADSTSLPVGYLVCNFPPPDKEGQSLLTHTDVVTLFHEFGHMLHHLLTRIDYPSISGINGVPWDAVELPSQFMENFAWSYDVLVGASKHVETGEPLPRELFDNLSASRYFGEALSMLRQLEFALFDFPPACRSRPGERGRRDGDARRGQEGSLGGSATRTTTAFHTAFRTSSRVVTRRVTTATSGQRSWPPTRSRLSRKTAFSIVIRQAASGVKSSRSAAAATSWRPTWRSGDANRLWMHCCGKAGSARRHENRHLERELAERSPATRPGMAGFTAAPDVLVLQEIKQLTEAFPADAIREAGYVGVANGQKTYNGVAVISRSEGSDHVTDFPGFEDPQRRILAATIDGVRVVNLYVPNGHSVGSEKYDYKLGWLEALRGFLEAELKTYDKLVVLGDFNIAPDDRDVYDPQKWGDGILCSPQERAALQALVELGLTDVFRNFEQPEATFSWWDYRAAGFRRNAGLRIDLILASDAMNRACKASYIDREPRTWERPSDHTPVIAEFDL